MKRDIALREHPVCLVLYKRRFRCMTCRRTFTELDSVCGRYKRTTQHFREALAQQASVQSIARVAEQTKTGPRFVEECLEAWIEEQLANAGRSASETVKLPTPCFLGIDEFARRKGHCYDPIVCDVEKRTVVEVCEGRTQDEVVKLMERLDEPDAVKAVSMDMRASLRPAVQLCLPQAQIVVDHLHVIQHVMKAFRKIVSSFAHKTASVATAASGLDAWIDQVQQSDFAPLHQALSAFRKWRQEILAFFQFLPTHISNGFVEGKNNRTKAIMRQGYGYRNRHHLRLRIFLRDLA